MVESSEALNLQTGARLVLERGGGFPVSPGHPPSSLSSPRPRWCWTSNNTKAQGIHHMNKPARSLPKPGYWEETVECLFSLALWISIFITYFGLQGAKNVLQLAISM